MIQFYFTWEYGFPGTVLNWIYHYEIIKQMQAIRRAVTFTLGLTNNFIS